MTDQTHPYPATCGTRHDMPHSLYSVIGKRILSCFSSLHCTTLGSISPTILSTSAARHRETTTTVMYETAIVFRLGKLDPVWSPSSAHCKECIADWQGEFSFSTCSLLGHDALYGLRFRISCNLHSPTSDSLLSLFMLINDGTLYFLIRADATNRRIVPLL